MYLQDINTFIISFRIQCALTRAIVAYQGCLAGTTSPALLGHWQSSSAADCGGTAFAARGPWGARLESPSRGQYYFAPGLRRLRAEDSALSPCILTKNSQK